ncbi:ATP-binding protein [Streptomyces acidiscabies]|uniref:histidine kinase n=1 Tax=Streptomyces acidiscabies TaxID=42234 RepID=A0AAP6EEV8_9ACTN|nr:ATP-binding protein [Streptomyces acidiscabies]MBP5936193.1 HAMP domain-containing protein [Streptomyces sp. LBUM 1476]MBZ3915866.1 HAMP domain-containing protein [Streptomyces acidiscabies]MDX2960273.1 HAMP domain-containing protein [Streptomyces acidiscabies]MDX3019624.1 HAMP domain-containing protein [Streptomyces acidiscabies]MDX3793275.1 HAMP domain-containing protein [Streptomyces acidiscabies]
MSTNEVDAPTRPAPAPGPRGLRALADRWPFQRKLNVLVGLPLAVIAVLLTYVITDLLQESQRAEEAAQLVRDSAQVAKLVSLVEAEHQQAILLSVRHEASFDGGTPSADPYRVAQVKVDNQVTTVRDAFGGRLPAGESQALREIEGLGGLRSTIEQGYLPADNIDPAYTGAARALIDGLGLDRNSALATTFTGNLLDSLLRADAAHGAFETGVFSALTGDSNALIEFTGAVGAYEVYTYQTDRFNRFATAAQSDELGGIEHNTAQAAIDQHYAELSVDPSSLQATTTAALRTSLRQALSAYGDYQQQADNRLKITDSLIGQIADRADDAASSARWRVTLLLNLAVIGFILWIAFSVLVRRSVVRPVLALTGAAREVADVAGRELARVADDDAEESGSPRLRELPVTANDEIGELAEAFNNVQTTAAALLERQVLSRRNVAEMFGNVGRRVSNLTTRQLTLIDAVERGETDPALLERLYSIDHIAVRLRRNADSLMLLAGIRETVLDSGPAALTNVVRAALGQIEGYQRVELRAASEVMIEPDIIGDLTLMVAELLENAVSFSPADSPVEVAVRTHSEGASITVVDHGLGMSAERLAEENARLVRRERLDLVPTKVLGLFVVGALARRWEIEVTLSRTPGGGLTAEVALPSTLLLTLSGEEPPVVAPGPLVSRGSSGAGAGEAGRTSTERSVGTDDGHGAEPVSTTPLPLDAPGLNGASPDRTSPLTEAGAEDPTLPRRTTQPAEAPAPFIPRARSEEPVPADGPRPLKRRVRGATLRTTVDAAAQQGARASRPADADAVRDTLDEFEEAVARANADTAETTAPFTGGVRSGENGPETKQKAFTHDDVPSRRPPTDDRNPMHHQKHLPEGAEQ